MQKAIFIVLIFLTILLLSVTTLGIYYNVNALKCIIYDINLNTWFFVFISLLFLIILVYLYFFFTKRWRAYRYLDILFLFILGFFIRYLWISTIPTLPFSDFEYYYVNAKVISERGWEYLFNNTKQIASMISDPFIKKAYPSLIAIKDIGFEKFYLVPIFKIFHTTDIYIIKLANTIFSSLTILLTYITLDIIFRRNIAFISSLILAFSIDLIAMTSIIATETFYIFLIILNTILFIIILKMQNKFIKIISFLFIGILVGIVSLTRGVALFYFLAIILTLIVSSIIYKKKAFLSFTLCIIIGYLTIIIPLTHKDFKACLAWELATGFNIKSYGTWDPKLAEFGIKYAYANKKEREKLKKLGYKTVMKELTKLSPTELIYLWRKKIENFCASKSFTSIFWATHRLEQENLKNSINLEKLKAFMKFLQHGYNAFLLLIFLVSLIIFPIWIWTKYHDNIIKFNTLFLAFFYIAITFILHIFFFESQHRYFYPTIPFITIFSIPLIIEGRKLCIRKK